MIAGTGSVNMQYNWFKDNWQDCHCTPSGTITDMGNNLTGASPGFTDLNSQNWMPLPNSDLVNNGMQPLAELLPDYAVIRQYKKHQTSEPRPTVDTMDIGAFELCGALSCDLIFANGFE